ncbi:MAG TPA: hypothetical protein VGK01_15155 [Candidatus Angelobacter sp.]|jgi:hypothetical protein
MRNNAHAIEILLAGPSDVKREIQVARNVIDAWNAAHSHTENTVLQAIYWDTHAFPEIGDRPQGVINRQLVDRCDLLIAIFWKSIGSPTGVAPSGTIEEVERFRNSGRPVMLYFSEALLPHDADVSKIDQVRQYKKSLNNGLYWVFKSSSQFRQRLTVHLPQAIARLHENAANPGLLSNRWLQDENAVLNRIQAELETTQIVNDFPSILGKLRPLLLDCIALPKVARIKEARQNFQFLIRRITEVERFSFSSGTIADFNHKCDQLFSDIRAAFEQAAAIESLSEWEVVRYEDLKVRRAEHTTETAWNWADDKQCQCADCVEFRSLKLKIKDDLNPKFRAFFLKLKEQFSQLRLPNNFESSNVWRWIDTNVKSAKRFQESFQIQEQSQNAHLAERVVHVLGQFKNVPVEDRKKYTRTDFEKMFMTVEPLVQMFEGLNGPA